MDSKIFSELRVKDFSGTIIPSNIYYYEEVSSTNDMALKLASSANDGALVIADRQTAGRGRFGRRWVTPPSVNITISLILKPQMNQKHTPKITIMSSLGIAKGIEKIIELKPKIKWPNDILLSNKKFCGILTEIKGNKTFVIVGIGININMERGHFPFEFKNKATSLRIELHRKLDRFVILHSVLKEIDELYSLFKQDGFEKIISGWKSYTEPFFGQRIRVSTIGKKENIIEGIVLDIDSDGNLILRDDEAMIHYLSAGEATML